MVVGMMSVMVVGMMSLPSVLVGSIVRGDRLGRVSAV